MLKHKTFKSIARFTPELLLNLFGVIRLEEPIAELSAYSRISQFAHLKIE